MADPRNPATGLEQEGSVFLRIVGVQDRSKVPVAISLIEIDQEGYIPREVGLGEDGTPVYVTRPGEYGRWNDSPMPRTPPRSPGFANAWGRLGSPISAEEFESAYGPAAATLPHTIGGTPIWVSQLVSCSILLALVAFVVALVFVLVRLFAS